MDVRERRKKCRNLRDKYGGESQNISLYDDHLHAGQSCEESVMLRNNHELWKL